MGGLSRSTFTSTWGIFACDDSCTILIPALNDGCFVRQVGTSIQWLGSGLRSISTFECLVEGAHVTHVSIELCLSASAAKQSFCMVLGVPVFRAWVSPCCFELILLLKQSDDELMFIAKLQKQAPVATEDKWTVSYEIG